MKYFFCCYLGILYIFLFDARIVQSKNSSELDACEILRIWFQGDSDEIKAYSDKYGSFENFVINRARYLGTNGSDSNGVFHTLAVWLPESNKIGIYDFQITNDGKVGNFRKMSQPSTKKDLDKWIIPDCYL